MKTLSLSCCLLAVAIPAQAERLINQRDMYPSPSPDGSQIVFESNRTGTSQLFIMNHDGTGIRQLTEFPLGAETPVFSPDGSLIAFAAYVGENNNDVYIMRPDGSGQTRLTDGPGYDGHPHWRADGERIAFNSDRSSPDPDAAWSDRWHEIYSMAADGGDVQQHTRCESVCTYGSLSPDGRHVLYRKVTDSPAFSWSMTPGMRNSDIYLANLDGSGEVNLAPNAAFDGWPVFSPDGQRVAFASNRAGPALTGHIWLVNLDGSGLQQVTHGDLSHVQPAWSADGKSIYVYQNRETPEAEYGTVARISLSGPAPQD